MVCFATSLSPSRLECSWEAFFTPVLVQRRGTIARKPLKNREGVAFLSGNTYDRGQVYNGRDGGGGGGSGAEKSDDGNNNGGGDDDGNR